MFNVEQIDSLPAPFHAPAAPRIDAVPRIERAEEFFAATEANLSHGGTRALYRPSTDTIVLPSFESFRDAQTDCATLAHPRESGWQ